MCDYSLMGVPNRLAREGEELVVFTFPTNTKGFASSANAAGSESSSGKPPIWEALKNFLRLPHRQSVTAVCIPPGARLELRDIPGILRHSLDVGLIEEVTFTQLTSVAHSHRDAVRFSNGAEVLLQRLFEGQRAKVLSFDLGARRAPAWGDLVPHFA